VTGLGRRKFLLKALASGGLISNCLADRAALLGAAVTSMSSARMSGADAAATGLITPSTDFFVRNHFGAPGISSDTWALDVAGLVSKPVQVSYSDLLLMPSLEHPFTLECAGNPPGGGGVGTPVWSGVPLAALLKEAGIQEGASAVVFHGADSGDGEGVPPGAHFARAIPLEKAMEPTTLLAYQMNGDPLPADHGFPVRALVPGWYGMDSVKWLTRIEVLGQPFEGYFQREQYVSARTNGERQPITRMLVNSKIIRPLEGEEIRSKTYRVEGAAWAGERKVAKVEVRLSGGGDWQRASLEAMPAAMVWTPWSYDWHIPRPGQYTLEIRASDEDGNTQPDARDPNRKDLYELNTPQRVGVKVLFRAAG
jgi:DMSO/TMAO reductase YedYZ molybdopterin-dependent catalytic subunit